MSPRRLVRALFSVAVGVAILAPAQIANAAPPPTFTYVTMSDGVRIAIAVSYPEGFDPTSEATWPTLYMQDGYDGGGGALNPGSYGNKYVMVHSSVRGTGCSGGRFDLFDRRQAMDGYEVIENWIVQQPWSNGEVGIIGHSYAGITGFLVASTSPPHVEAIAVSGLIDDLYRGIVYLGGVPDLGFPLIWTAGFRPASELAGNQSRFQSDPECRTNILSRPVRDVPDDPIVQGLTSPFDDDWWKARSTLTWINGISAPIHITQQYQDEQTGPRGGPHLWEQIPRNLPKRLVMTNGVHSTTSIAHNDRRAWLDCWIIQDGQSCGAVADPKKRVQVHFETTSGNVNPPYVSRDFPLPETQWRRYYLRQGGALSTQPPTTNEPGDSYLSLPEGRQVYVSNTLGGKQFDDAIVGPIAASSGPDEVRYSVTFNQRTPIAGPIVARLWASSLLLNAEVKGTLANFSTDFFVQLIDVDPQGNYSYLQRGMLRASHRAVDPLRSDRIRSGPMAGEIYRPYHPHSDTQTVAAGQAYEYVIEIFPVGHLFRPGHTLLLKVHAPPLADSLYAYASAQFPSQNTILHDPAHPSSLLLPVLPHVPPVGAEPGCGQQFGVRCVRPARP